MKRVIRIFGLAMVLSALLVVSIGGAALAANGPHGGDGAPYGDGDCVCDGDCICRLNCGDAFQNGENLYKSYQGAGPHGTQNQKGKADLE